MPSITSLSLQCVRHSSFYRAGLILAGKKKHVLVFSVLKQDEIHPRNATRTVYCTTVHLPIEDVISDCLTAEFRRTSPQALGSDGARPGRHFLHLCWRGRGCGPGTRDGGAGALPQERPLQGRHAAPQPQVSYYYNWRL